MIDVLRMGLGKTKAEESKRKELERDYRTTFRSPAGRRVFRHMLEELCFFDPSTNSDQAALKNYASILIYRLGIRNTEALANQILNTKTEED